MEDQRRVPLFVPVPTSLKIVAWLWIIFGWLAVLGMIGSLFQGRISINLTALGVFIGPGLLKFKEGWRICALVLSWITIIIIAIAALFLLAHSGGNFNVNFMGRPATGIPSFLGTLMMFFLLAGLALAMLWEIWVLSRSDVRILFQPNRSYSLAEEIKRETILNQDPLDSNQE